MRLIILLALAWLCWRTLKSWMTHNLSVGGKENSGRDIEVDDVMVKDPQCEVYIPKKEAIHAKINNRDYYFCSRECLQEFRAEQKKR